MWALFEQAVSSSAAALDVVKRDVGEFCKTVSEDTTNYVNGNAATPFGDSKQGNATRTRGPPGHELSTSQRPLTQDMLQTTDYGRQQTKLESLQEDIKTYSSIPEPKHEFEQWRKTLDLDAHSTEMSKLLMKQSIRSLHAKLVPTEVMPRDFWHRYFYRVHLLQQEDERRAALKAFASQQATENELEGWDDDDGWEGTGDWQPITCSSASATDSTPKVSVSSEHRNSASMTSSLQSDTVPAGYCATSTPAAADCVSPSALTSLPADHDITGSVGGGAESCSLPGRQPNASSSVCTAQSPESSSSEPSSPVTTPPSSPPSSPSASGNKAVAARNRRNRPGSYHKRPGGTHHSQPSGHGRTLPSSSSSSSPSKWRKGSDGGHGKKTPVDHHLKKLRDGAKPLHKPDSSSSLADDEAVDGPETDAAIGGCSSSANDETSGSESIIVLAMPDDSDSSRSQAPLTGEEFRPKSQAHLLSKVKRSVASPPTSSYGSDFELISETDPSDPALSPRHGSFSAKRKVAGDTTTTTAPAAATATTGSSGNCAGPAGAVPLQSAAVVASDATVQSASVAEDEVEEDWESWD